MQGQRYPPGSCACICACRRDHESWPGGESRRRDLNRSLAAGLQALPGPPSSLRSSPTGFRRPPSHESPPAAGHECACFVGCTKKLLLDRIYRIIRIMKSPKALAHCKNLVNPVNPVSKNEPWEEGLQLAYSWSRAAQIQSVREIGGDGPHETRILQTFHHSGEISATATLPRGFMVQ